MKKFRDWAGKYGGWADRFQAEKKRVGHKTSCSTLKGWAMSNMQKGNSILHLDKSLVKVAEDAF